MPRITHDGAAQLGDLFQDLPEEVGREALHALLRHYFDDAREGGREAEGPPADDLIAGLEAWPAELERSLFGPVGDLAERETWPVVLVNDFRTRVAAEVRARAGTPPGQVPPPQRIFVSHRQADHAEARSLARTILLHGKFDVWLDVWDPLLRLVGRSSLDPTRQSLLTALIIEVGLMNARAVLALMTPNSRGSDWIPYEYGRVKKGGPFAEIAAAALAPALAQGSLPEYMRLGPVVPWDEVRLHPTALHTWLDRL